MFKKELETHMNPVFHIRGGILFDLAAENLHSVFLIHLLHYLLASRSLLSAQYIHMAEAHRSRENCVYN